jgi:hypothetical protein
MQWTMAVNMILANNQHNTKLLPTEVAHGLSLRSLYCYSYSYNQKTRYCYRSVATMLLNVVSSSK